MPSNILPMLAKPAKLPIQDPEYRFEIKWDGIRAITYLDRGSVCIHSRNLIDITARYPELRPLGNSLRSRQLILDGEIVAFGSDERPSFSRLQERMGLTLDSDIRFKMLEVPVVYVVFDLLYLDGRSLLSNSYLERRSVLEELGIDGPNWQTPVCFEGAAAEILAMVHEHKLEGIVAKQIDSRYEPGQRSRCWLKIKSQPSQEFVIGGYMPGAGRRKGTIGSLLLGYYDMMPGDALRHNKRQRFIYAGKAGTGFTDAALDQLQSLLEPLRRTSPPFDEGLPRMPGAVFVEPQLVGEFEFTEWTDYGITRHPSFKGLRNDKDPHQVVREIQGRR